MKPAFVLVHGAWHDARAWDLLCAELDRRDRRAVAVELPSDAAAVGAPGYARTIAAAVREVGPEPPVLVGHSMSGIAIPLVPALAPVRRLVFLAGLVPAPGRRMADLQAEEPMLGDTGGIARDELGRSYWTSPEAAIATLYHDCDHELAHEAASRLRPQARTPHEEPCPLAAFPDVPTSYILMREDRMVRPEWSRIVCRDRLGVEPVELPGGHSPMLADPDLLAATLIGLARA